MKKLLLLSFLFSITFFLSCDNDDLLPEVATDTQQDDATTTDEDGDATLLSLNQFDGYSLTDEPVSSAVADFYIANENGAVVEGTQIAISNTSIDAVSYEWDFGNGDVLEGENPEYAFPYHGYYEVTLKVTDSKGLVSTAKQGLVVICIFGGGDHSN